MASQQSSNTEPATTENPYPYTLRGNPNLTFTLSPLILETSFEDVSYTPIHYIQPPAESIDLLPSALQPAANDRYPLLTTDRPPFPYVVPALVMPPTAEEAQFDFPHRVPLKLPVATPYYLTVEHPKALKAKSGPRAPVYYGPTVQIYACPQQTAPVANGSSAAASATTATLGNMNPPSYPFLKRKRDD